MPAHDDSGQFLRTYLQDHLAAAAAGLGLARRCHSSNEGTEYAEELGAIARQIEEDRDALEELMARLDIPPSRVKSAMATISQVAGQLKCNGRIVRYSPLSRVLELEALTGGIAAKRDLWRALANVADDHPKLDRAELDELIERATSQIERVHDLHTIATREAFTAR